MVVTGSPNQLLERIIDAAAYSMRSAEIHRSTFYLYDFSGCDGYLIHRSEMIGIDSKDIVFNARSRGIQTSQAEECMVGQIDNGTFVCLCRVGDDQFILVGEGIDYCNIQIAGKSFFAIFR